jgi:DNA repair and recombination protein RAD52
MDRSEVGRKLARKIPYEHLRFRSNGPAQVAYLEGWTVIEMANEIFGYDGWSSEVKKMDADYIDTSQGMTSVGVTSVVRITLRDGTYREDVGCGAAENVRGKGKAVEQAKKSAITDALKRAFRQFGNALGNCCYDKEYIERMKEEESSRRRGARGREAINGIKKGGLERRESYISIDDLPESES